MIAERPDATGRTSLGPEIARAFIDRSLDGFFVHDEDGRIVAVNEAACTSTGYTRAELLRMNALDIVQVTVGEARHNWELALAGTMLVIPAMHRRKDGSTFPWRRTSSSTRSTADGTSPVSPATSRSASPPSAR